MIQCRIEPPLVFLFLFLVEFFSLFFPFPLVSFLSVKHITLTKQTVSQPVNQPAISKKISVQQFGVVLHTQYNSKYICMCVRSYTLERLNNVKVIFISIFWINFSRKINNNLFSISAVSVRIQFWFLFSFRFVFHSPNCVGNAPANGLESWDNFILALSLRHPPPPFIWLFSLFKQNANANNKNRFKISVLFRSNWLFVYLRTSYKTWGPPNTIQIPTKTMPHRINAQWNYFSFEFIFSKMGLSL